jgi:hypothetical protein
MQELTIKTLGWKHERLRDGGAFEAGKRKIRNKQKLINSPTAGSKLEKCELKALENYDGIWVR